MEGGALQPASAPLANYSAALPLNHTSWRPALPLLPPFEADALPAATATAPAHRNFSNLTALLERARRSRANSSALMSARRLSSVQIRTRAPHMPVSLLAYEEPVKWADSVCCAPPHARVP